MKDDTRLPAALAENILVVLCFDKDKAKTIRLSVSPRTFESVIFREVAGKAIDYLDQFGEPIGEHLADEFDEILQGDDSRKAASYTKVLDNLFSARNSVNADYVLTQLHKFVRQQNLKAAFVAAVEAFEAGDVDKAEIELSKGLEKQALSFEPGLNLSDPKQVLNLMDDPHEEGISLGVDEFDRLGFQLRRKTLTLFIGARGKGKSWSCVHAAKMALIQQWSVVIYSLEMSEKDYAVRVLQAFFSISQREAEVEVARFTKDKKGELSDMIFERLERKSMRDDKVKAEMVRRVREEFPRRPPLIIKQFPSGALTMAALEAHLDGLERYEKIVPDLVILDYPDLMKHDVKNKRIELGQLFVDFRGIMVKRNAAGFAPTQGNRESDDARVVTGDMVSEDISKNNTADGILTYSQTDEEYKIGLARLYIEKNRTGKGKAMVLLSQAYEIGQFCLDSVKHRGNYWQMLEDKTAQSDSPTPPRRRSR